MKLNLTTGERLCRVWHLFSAGVGDVHRRTHPYVIMISGSPDGRMLYSRPGSVTVTRYMRRATAQRHAERLARLYPGLRTRAMKRISSAPLDATLRRHARVLSW